MSTLTRGEGVSRVVGGAAKLPRRSRVGEDGARIEEATMGKSARSKRKRALSRAGTGGLAGLLSAKSSLSFRSPASLLSALSVGSILSFGSVLSIGSFGSILSIGCTGSILSIGSAGSILSIGSVGSVLSIGGAGAILNQRREEDESEG